MKLSANKKIVGLFLSLAISSVAHAENRIFELKNPTEEQQLALQELMEQGLVVALPGQADWYQINQDRLDESLRSENVDAEAQKTVEMLRKVTGDETRVQIVPILEAHHGTQDFGGV